MDRSTESEKDPPVREASRRGLLRFVLRQLDQASAAICLVGALVVIAVCQVHLAWRREGTVEIDRTEAREAALVVDLNTAEWAELANLPGIGEALARRIVAYREDHGPFRRVADLSLVDGIGPIKLAQVQSYLVAQDDDP
jgi:competence protein ComEA